MSTPGGARGGHGGVSASHAGALLADALAEAEHPAISCSFQPGGLAVLHLLREQGARIPVLFVDTGYHFQQTFEFMHRMTAAWDLDLRVVSVDHRVKAQEAQVGRLYATNPALCCRIRKTDPLFAALGGHDLWITGLRRAQSPTRAGAVHRERRVLPGGEVITKLNPIADWSDSALEAYLTIHEIPRHPLLAEGFPSIGCAPCTERPLADADARSGRWGGVMAECGLHTELTVAGGD